MAGVKLQFGCQDVQLLEREPCHEGFFQLQRFHFKHRLFKGGWSDVLLREVFIRGSATCVLPYDPLREQIVLLEQIRAGALLDGGSPWLLELIAGINDKGEVPEDIARREAVEEADIELQALIPIYKYYPSPGGATEMVHLFCAQVDASQASGIHGLEEEGEDIKVHVLELEEAYAMLSRGEINNSPAIMAIQWLMLNKQSVHAVWLGE